jgi:hypothetical protein
VLHNSATSAAPPCNQPLPDQCVQAFALAGCSIDTKADVFYYIGVTGSKSADVGAFKLNVDNTAAAT